MSTQNEFISYNMGTIIYTSKSTIEHTLHDVRYKQTHIYSANIMLFMKKQPNMAVYQNTWQTLYDPRIH